MFILFFFLLKHYRPTNRPIAYFTDMDFIFILLLSLAQRRLASDKAKSVQREPGENVEQRLFNVTHTDNEGCWGAAVSISMFIAARLNYNVEYRGCWGAAESIPVFVVGGCWGAAGPIPRVVR